MKKICIVLAALLSVFPVTALEEVLTLGTVDQWKDLASMENVQFFTSTNGYSDIILAENEYLPDPATDLLLHFNSARITDSTGNYTVSENNILVSDSFAKAGGGSAAFRGEHPGIRLNAHNRNSLFAPGRVWNDFTIEFWLYPAQMKSGETIFLFKSSRLRDGKVIPQRIECKFENNRLLWNFENVFLPESQAEYSVRLRGKSMLVPRYWHHHQLRFDSSTGLVEYLLDGVPEGIEYANRDKAESGHIFLPYIGEAEKGSLLIGLDLLAFIDEFRVSAVSRDLPELARYGTNFGEITSDFLDLGYTNSEILRIDSEYENISNSEILYYYRVANDVGEIITDESTWTQFKPGEEFYPSPKGRLLQLRCRLYPDGEGRYSPRLETIRVHFIPDLPPLPPERISAVAGNGKITLRWAAVAEEDVAGYLIYFGERSGQYLGKTLAGKSSPLNTGNTTEFTIEGLENGKLYYFSLCAYDSAKTPHISGFSAEVSARPSGLYKE
ncbi:MAG: fibronectin type III domain-containing protein [Spirochaetales bacterium]|nr:fibronectin type III domain-containing protein [Spirochaetales bacterium]